MIGVSGGGAIVTSGVGSIGGIRYISAGSVLGGINTGNVGCIGSPGVVGGISATIGVCSIISPGFSTVYNPNVLVFA